MARSALRSGSLPTLLCAATLATAGPLAGQGVVHPFAEVETARLDNGFTVVVDPRPYPDTVSLAFVVRSGASTQVEERQEGLPHVLEHMLFRAFRSPTGETFSDRIRELGGTYGGATRLEGSMYRVTVPEAELARGVELVAGMVIDPTFRGETLIEERAIIQSEFEQSATDPYFLMDRITDLTLWGEGFRQRNTVGNMTTISGATTERLDNYYMDHYRPGNSALVVSGDVSLDQLVSLVDATFGEWSSGGADVEEPMPTIQPVAIQNDTVVVVEASVPDVSILVRWQGPSLSEDPRAADAALVYEEMVNHEGSATRERLVTDGVLESVSLQYEPDTRGGTLSLRARTSPENLLEASRALRQEVQVLGRAWAVDAEAFEQARGRLLERYATEGIRARTRRVALGWARGELSRSGDPAPLTVQDLQAFVTGYFQGRPRVCAFMLSAEVQQTRLEELVAAATLWTGQ